MWIALMIGNNDGQGHTIGQFDNKEEAQQFCEQQELAMRKTLPPQVQADIAHQFAEYKMQWTELNDRISQATTLPPLLNPSVNGVVHFKVEKIEPA